MPRIYGHMLRICGSYGPQVSGLLIAPKFLVYMYIQAGIVKLLHVRPVFIYTYGGLS